jgi:nucleoside-diphosphate-sugar epimerase
VRVFVAGASGAVGRRLIPQLVAAGHAVVALTRVPARTAALLAAGADAVVGDVFDRDGLLAIVRAAVPDAIIHQLTDLPASMNPRQLEAVYERNNRVRREGTRNLVAAAVQSGVRRFVVQSMATWYRPEGGLIKSESDPLWTDAPEPIGEAVRTVATMETSVLRETPIGVVLRYGAFYGAGTWYAPDGAIAKRIRSRAYPIVSDGAGITSFIHVDDAASAAVSALHARASAVYNVVDDEPAPAAEWIPAYAAAVGAPRPLRVPVFLARLIVGKALTAWMTTMRGASNAKIAAELGWRPKRPSWRNGIATND